MMTISKNFKRFAGIALSAALLVTGVVVPKKLHSVDAASNIDLSEIAIGDGSAISLSHSLSMTLQERLDLNVA